jgi:hypothetical protein
MLVCDWLLITTIAYTFQLAIESHMFEPLIQWFSNFQNVLGLVLISGSVAILLATLQLSSKEFEIQ